MKANEFNTNYFKEEKKKEKNNEKQFNRTKNQIEQLQHHYQYKLKFNALLM